MSAKDDDLPKSVEEFLPVEKLRIDSSYQRPLSDTNLRKIEATPGGFKGYAAGHLRVSCRASGEYYVIDGQHRLELYKKHRYVFARCEVFSGLSMQDEARWFAAWNFPTKPSRNDLMRSRIAGGDDAAKAIMAILEKHGFSIPLSQSRNARPKVFVAVFALEEIYKKYGAAFLDTVIRIISQAWPDDLDARKEYILRGLALFVSEYASLYKESYLILRLQSVTAMRIKALASAQCGPGGKTMWKATSDTIRNLYNRNIKGNRLPEK